MNRKISYRKISYKERQQVLKRRDKGMDYKEIAKELGIKKWRAYYIIKKYRNDLKAKPGAIFLVEPVEPVVKVDTDVYQRLDEAQKGYDAAIEAVVGYEVGRRVVQVMEEKEGLVKRNQELEKALGTMTEAARRSNLVINLKRHFGIMPPNQYGQS